MDIKYFINICLIILVLHIILLNINFNIKIGNKSNLENFDNNMNNSGAATIDFLKNDSNDDFKKRLLNYIQQDEQQQQQQQQQQMIYKNKSDVIASNSYTDDKNVPNFESNVADIKQFYKVDFDNLGESDLKNYSKEIGVSKDNVINTSNVITPYGREAQPLPDNWNYKDELPMNGGLMNGIGGFDNLESQFASFGSAGTSLNLQQANDSNFKNIPHDDLRKPIVYNN